MKNYILALTVFLLLFAGPFHGSAANIVDWEIAMPETSTEIEPESPEEGLISIRVPEWIINELTEPIISEFIYFDCNNRYIVQDGTANIYYLDKDEYSERISIINPPDFALVKNIYPEEYTLIDSIEIDEIGETINVSVADSSFFTSAQRAHVHELAYQCALVKCMLGVDENDISINLNYTIMESNEKISYSIPYRMKSVIDSTDDIQQEFTIHVPTEYTMGDPELTKQQLIQAGVKDITINADGTIDYIAAKELILQMAADYYNTLEIVAAEITSQTNYITEIYYNDFKTYIYIKIDSTDFNQNELFSIMDFLSYNNQFFQLFAGVKPEDIQFKITVIDNEYNSIIVELTYPKYSE